MSRHLQVLIFYFIVYSLSRIDLKVVSVIFVSKLCTLVLSAGRSDEFTSEMMIECLTYFTYAQMDVCLLINHMQSCKVNCFTCYLSSDTLTQKRFPYTQHFSVQVSLIICQLK